jgi:hypothetical protein
MHTSDYSTHFTPQENEWLSTNPKTKKELFEEIEDISNVNPLDNGEPDLRPLEIAIKATKLVIQVSKINILEGPYDAAHFQLIKSSFPKIAFSEKAFWLYFSFECACKKEEGYRNKQRIYLGAIADIILSENLNDTDIDEGSLGVYNMKTNKIEYLKVKGVNFTI